MSAKIKSYNSEKLITNIIIKNGNYEVGHIEIQDPRIKQIKLLEVAFDNPNNYMAFELQDISTLATDSFKTVFLTPNNISILLYVYRNELKKYKLTLKNHVLKNYLGEKHKNENKLTFTSKMIYEMIQYAEAAIIFGYTAVEAFANACIPDNYIYEFINNKGIVEKYNSIAIERWLSLSDKLKSILGVIFGKKELTSQKFWSDFKKLESLRNSIIHLKKEDNDFFHIFFKEETIEIIKSVDKVIKYFIDLETDVDMPLNDFDGKVSFAKSIVLAKDVKNMEVNYLSELEAGKTVKLKELIDSIKDFKS